ncbi:MAG TPA: transporter substrate-binding domain-containing protein [bacterium]|nr:transporter substrate-binding domain-containing protein [bacterium]HPN30451.1 transporter substrate-binding domain-containing protein [bacterium]
MRLRFLLTVFLILFILGNSPHSDNKSTLENTRGFPIESVLFEKFTDEEKQWLDKHPLITLAPDPHFPPLEFFDNGKYSGFFADYFKLIESRLGIKFNFIQMENWDYVIETAKKHSIDGITAAQITPERLKYLNFTSSILDIPNSIIVSDKSGGFISLENLTGKTVVLTEGNALHEYIKNNYPKIIIKAVKDDLTALKEVSFYNADAAVVNLAIASYLIEKHGISNLKVSGDSGKSNPLAIAVRNDSPVLLKILQKTVDSISDSEKNEIYKKWISLKKDDLIFNNKFLKTAGVIAGAIILIFIAGLFWNFFLRKQAALITKKLQNEFAEKMRVLNELRESEEHFRIIFDNALDGILVADSETLKFFLANNNICKLTGYSNSELLSMNVKEIHPENEFENIKKYFFKQLNNEVLTAPNIPVKKKDGTIFYADINSSSITIKGKKYLLGIFRDISERKKLEGELEYVQGLLKAAFEQNPVPMILIDYQNKKTRICNSAALELFGIDKASTDVDKASTDADKTSPDASIEEKLKEINGILKNSDNKENVVSNEEYKIIRKDGTERWAIIYSAPIINKNKEKIAELLIFPDITNIKLQEREINEIIKRLKTANEELNSLDKLKNNILSNVSHELRTPLVAIRGFSELIEKINSEALTSIQKEYLKKIITNVDRLVGIVNDLINFSRIEKGTDRLHLEKFNLSLVISESILLHAAMIKSKHINVKIEIDDPELIVRADKNKILQAVNNLLSNAVKFSNQGGIVIISASKLKDGSVQFKIEDFGIGIPADKTEKIFERFYQADSSSIRAYAGLGLGLAICRNIIELHSGAIQVQSELNKGSVFSFTLPPYKESENQDNNVSGIEIINSKPAPAFKTALKKKTILIIDDDDEILEFIYTLLDFEDFNPIKCKNPKDALMILKNQAIDVILLDVSMKDINGIDVCRTLKSNADYKNVPVIMVTARAETSVRQICLDAGADDIIVKPFSNKELINKIYEHFVKG